MKKRPPLLNDITYFYIFMIAGYISDNTGRCNFNLSSKGLGQIRTVRYDYVCVHRSLFITLTERPCDIEVLPRFSVMGCNRLV